MLVGTMFKKVRASGDMLVPWATQLVPSSRPATAVLRTTTEQLRKLQTKLSLCVTLQAQDRCHRIGQTREVHIYRLVSEKTIEENILTKSDQKRQLDHLAIQSGGFNTEFLQKFNPRELLGVQPGGRGPSPLPPSDLNAADLSLVV